MLAGHGLNKIIEAVKIGIVGAKFSGQFPYPLDWIQLGAVRREEFQGQNPVMFLEERMKDNGMMVFCIVQDDHHLFSSPAILK